MPLRIPVYRRIFTAGLVSYQGRFIDLTTLAWLVAEGSESPLAVALLTTFRFLPFLLVGPFVGVVLDRFPLLRVIRLALLASSLLVIALAAASTGSLPPIWVLYVYASATGLLWTFEFSGRRALIRRTGGNSCVTSGLALELMLWYLGSMIGANIAGLLLTRIPISTLLAAVSVTYLAGLVLMWNLRVPECSDPAPRTESPLRSLIAGLRVARQSRVLLAALSMVAVANAFGFGFEAMTPLFAVDTYEAGSIGLGLFISAAGIGAIVGTTVLASVGGGVTRHGRLFVLATIGIHATTMLFALSPGFGVALAVLLAGGVAANMFGVMSGSLIVMNAPENSYGRLIGLQIAAIGMFPIGSAVLGVLANELGPRSALMVMASIGTLLTVAIALAIPELIRHRSTGAETAA